MFEAEHIDLEDEYENDFPDEGARRSKNVQATKDDKLLLHEVDIVGATKNAGGAKVWVCKHCHEKFTSSYTRIHIHFFGAPVRKTAGIQRCTALLKDRVKYESLLKKVKLVEQTGVSRSLKNSVINKKQTSNSKKPLEESFGVLERNSVDKKVMKGLCATGTSYQEEQQRSQYEDDDLVDQDLGNIPIDKHSRNMCRLTVNPSNNWSWKKSMLKNLLLRNP
ncbi:hypothetical protein L1887_33761 [Cichorium endivia]|nr:hypothetical protein L1887_33761 [Cichorium endivia]